jgi:TRAP transporter TAXI family solute receptor
MMKIITSAAVWLAGSLMLSTANAQVVSIVTTPSGSYTNSAGAAMAKVISEKSTVRAIIQAQGGAGLDPVEAGNADFGLGNSFDSTFYVTGTAYYSGNGQKKNLRHVATMVPYRVGMFVRADSGIKTLADLKGKRVSAGFNAQKTIGRLVEAELANGGLTYNDVKKVLTPSVRRAADDFIAGKVETLFFAIGSAVIKQAAATLGELRVLPIDTSPAAVKRMQEMLPNSYVITVKPAPGLDGIHAPTPLIANDMDIFTNKKLPDDVIYKVVKALHDNKPMLVSIFRPFVAFDPARMATVVKDVPFHPGTLKYYKEIGIAPKQ